MVSLIVKKGLSCLTWENSAYKINIDITAIAERDTIFPISDVGEKYANDEDEPFNKTALLDAFFR